MKNRPAALSAGRIHVDNSGVNCYNKSVEPRRLPHWTFHNDEGLTLKTSEPPVWADGSLFLAVKKLVPNLDQNPDNGDKPEHLARAYTLRLPFRFRGPSGNRQLFTSTIVVAEFHGDYYILSGSKCQFESNP